MPEEINTEPVTLEVNEPTITQAEPVETFDREYVEKLRKENASYRTKAKENAEKAEKAKVAAERAKLDEIELVKAEREDALKELAAARAETARAKQIAALTGKVIDPEDALAIAERAGLVDDDGSVDVEKLLAAKPFLAPATPGSTAIDAARARTGATGELRPEDFKGKSQEWIAANLPRLKKPRT